MPESRPPIVQIAVDMSLGLMPVIRARSGFVADARTASPNTVWPRSHHSAIVTIGTTINASSCGPVMTTFVICRWKPPRCRRKSDEIVHFELIGVGKTVWNLPVR